MKAMSSQDFGQLLRAWRLEQGYGLRQFAKVVGELPSNLSAIETGARAPWRNMEKLREIAGALALEEGGAKWDRFFLAARRDDALPPDIDRLLERQLNVALLRTVDEMQLSDDELAALVEDLRHKRIEDAKQRDGRRPS
jgi:transcriptional regulator with XRE-family HTH domain